MKIFLDFDDTIFNTAQFKADYMKLYLDAGITEAEFKREYYTETKEKERVLRKHDPVALLDRLETLKGVSFDTLKGEIVSFLDNIEKYVFKDFYEFVKEFPKNELGLLSYGNIFFQSKKVAGTHIEKYFSIVKITDQHKGDVLKELLNPESIEKETIFFIDDRPDKLLEVRDTIKNAVLLRIMRKEGRYNELSFPADIITCEDLIQAGDIIHSFGPALKS